MAFVQYKLHKKTRTIYRRKRASTSKGGAQGLEMERELEKGKVRGWLRRGIDHLFPEKRKTTHLRYRPSYLTKDFSNTALQTRLLLRSRYTRIRIDIDYVNEITKTMSIVAKEIKKKKIKKKMKGLEDGGRTRRKRKKEKPRSALCPPFIAEMYFQFYAASSFA